MSHTLTIRADASPTIGTGHVMRMIALGQAWRDKGGKVTFAGSTGLLEDRLQKEGFTLHRLESTHPAPADLQSLLDITTHGDWIALDGYHFDTRYQRGLRNAGRHTLILDDICDRKSYDADILLNQNPDAAKLSYTTNSEALRLLGTRYALIRKEFTAHSPGTLTPVAKNVLITMGGADPANTTAKVMDSLRSMDIPNIAVKIVVGSANPERDNLREKAQNLPCPCDLLFNVSDMAPLMLWADAAITAAGSTCWELCYFGVPMLAIKVAANQRGVSHELERHGAALCLDKKDSCEAISNSLRSLCLNQSMRQSLQDNAHSLIDGKGAERVVNTMRNATMVLRPAQKDDCRRLYDWRNHPSIRQQSFNNAPIDYAGHERWFLKKLTDTNCLLFIAEDNTGTPVGQFRFDIAGSEAIVSVSVAPGMTSHGLGTIITSKACQELSKSHPGVTAVALVKPDNPGSATMFKKAGFIQIASSMTDHLRFEWKS